MSSFSLTLQPLLAFVSENPMMRLVQAGLLLGGSLVIFLLFYATRDIILRTRSFLYQFACILMVAALPVVGFLLYLLVRPARTLKERQAEAMMKKIIDMESQKEQRRTQSHNMHQHHQHKQDKDKKNLIAKQAAAKAIQQQREKSPLKPVEVGADA